MPKTIEVSVDIKKESDKAYLVNDGRTETWLPKSQIFEKTELRDNHYEIIIPEWLALKKGLI